MLELTCVRILTSKHVLESMIAKNNFCSKFSAKFHIKAPSTYFSIPFNIYWFTGQRIIYTFSPIEEYNSLGKVIMFFTVRT